MKKSTITVNTIDGKTFQVLSSDPISVVNSLTEATTGVSPIPSGDSSGILRWVRREHIASIFVSGGDIGFSVVAE